MSSSPPVRCAIIGCGQVAHEYAATLAGSADVTLTGCHDIDDDRALAFARQHGLPAALQLDDLLDPARFDLAVVLTPPAEHATVAQRVVDAGLAVHVEKPIALDLADARRLCESAAAAGVVVGAAPDTVHAAPIQTAAAAIRAGLIGQPTGAAAAHCASGPERWHPAPEPFHALGPLNDMGPYYLTQLVALLGRIVTVSGATARTRPDRTIATGPHAGTAFTATAATHIDATLTTATGLPVALTASWDIAATARPHLEIYGMAGTLLLPDPNFHTGPVLLRPAGARDWTEVSPARPAVTPVGRGMGVIATAGAIRGAPLATDGQLGTHVLAVITAIGDVARTGRAATVEDHP